MTQEVIVFGFVPLAEKVIWHLYGLRSAKIAGVVTVDQELPEWRSTNSEAPVTETCEELNIPIVEEQDVTNHAPDIGLTVRYPHILSEKILNAFDYGVINFHGGHLPEYRGAHAANHVLLNNEKWHGATLHFCDPSIDTGPIVDRQKFKVQEKDTCYTLYQKAKIALWNMYVNNIANILSRDVNPISQSDVEVHSEPTTYYRDDIKGKKEIKLSSNPDDVLRLIRAFDFPTHKPAYTKIGGEEVHLRTGWNDSWPKGYNIPGENNE